MRIKKVFVSAIAFSALAFAGGALAPAAMAQTKVSASSSSSSSLASAQPDTVKACDSSTKNWAATYPTVGDWLVGRGATHCIGGVSVNSLPYNDTEVFCAGNNKGFVKYYDLKTLETATHSFYPDTSYEVVNGKYQVVNVDDVADPIEVDIVQITGDSGKAGC